MPEYLVIAENGEYDLVQVLTKEMEEGMVVLHLRQVKRLNHTRDRDKFWRVSYNPDHKDSPYRCWCSYEVDDSYIYYRFGDLSYLTKGEQNERKGSDRKKDT